MGWGKLAQPKPNPTQVKIYKLLPNTDLTEPLDRAGHPIKPMAAIPIGNVVESVLPL